MAASSRGAMPVNTGMAAYEDDDTRLEFVVESDLPRFLSLILQRTDQISQSKVDNEIVEQHIVVD